MANMFSDEFPRPISGSVVFVYDGRMMVWGGMSQIIVGEGDERFLVDLDLPDFETEGPVIEILDLLDYSWKRQTTFGDIPNMGRSSHHALIDCHLYLYGGNNDSGFCGGLYKLNLRTYTWSNLIVNCFPPAVASGGTAPFGSSIIFFGGVGEIKEVPVDHGCSYEISESFGYVFDYAWNNCLHEYDTLSGLWRELKTSGTRPPPSSRFTFNKIDPHRAILFGGKQNKYKVTFSDIYIYNYDMREWRGPYTATSEGEPWPPARGLHAASCLVDPDSESAEVSQYLFVIWGQGEDAKHVNNSWILHVQSMTWKQFIFPSFLKPRMFHMSCSYHIQDKQTDVVIYGGNKQRQHKFDRNVITCPVIVKFGSVEKLVDQCLSFVKSQYSSIQQLSNILPFSLRNKLTNEENNTTIIYPLKQHFK